MVRSMFDSTKKSLKELLDKAEEGNLQLPDFQRGWVWGDEDIRSLLASISQSFPVGALMTLETGGQISFKPRPVEGAPSNANSEKPEALLSTASNASLPCFKQRSVNPLLKLQMLRSALSSAGTTSTSQKRSTQKRAARKPLLDCPRPSALVRNFGRDVILDLSTPEQEYKELMFPVNRIFDHRDWRRGFEDHWRNRDDDKYYIYRRFEDEIVDAFDHYQLPVITLARATPKQAVCLVFEKVNTGGKKLDTFELLTAIYAADEFELRKDWYGDAKTGIDGRLDRLRRHATLQNIASTDFLQALALLHTRDLRREAGFGRADRKGSSCCFLYPCGDSGPAA